MIFFSPRRICFHELLCSLLLKGWNSIIQSYLFLHSQSIELHLKIPTPWPFTPMAQSSPPPDPLNGLLFRFWFVMVNLRFIHCHKSARKSVLFFEKGAMYRWISVVRKCFWSAVKMHGKHLSPSYFMCNSQRKLSHPYSIRNFTNFRTSILQNHIYFGDFGRCAFWTSFAWIFLDSFTATFKIIS